MKNLISSMKGWLLVFMLCCVQTVLWAQDNGGGSTSKTEVNISADTGDAWYTSPWVWVIGAAVFILLLVALTSGGRSRRGDGTTDRITVTKTVRRDTDV
jgi:hypothetical protein